MTPAPGRPPHEWSVVFPVKVLSAAKTRLEAGVPSTAELALAFFTDAVRAAIATPRVAEVVVATGDPRVRAAAESAGALVVDDAGHPGINAAARWGAQHCGRGRDIAVLVSDLPCLTPRSLEAALAAAEQHATSFLPDLDGTGTTMWCAIAPNSVDPRFGTSSRMAHRASGAVDLVEAHGGLAADVEPVRCDVDTEAALGRARGVGMGPATVDALAVSPR